MKKKKLLALLLSAAMTVTTVAPSTTVFAAEEMPDTTAPEWNTNGNFNWVINVEAGITLTDELLTSMTNANAVGNISDDSDGPFDVFADSYELGQIDTGAVGSSYSVHLYAADEAGNTTPWGIKIGVNIVDTTAPVWNYGGDINYGISIPVGTPLMEKETFIDKTNARNNVADNSGVIPKITLNNWAWDQIDTNVVSSHRIELFATDESGNCDGNLGITLYVVDEEAPEWNSNGNINYTVKVPVGTELTQAEFIEKTNAAANVKDNYTAPEDINIAADDYHWEQIDTNKVGVYKVALFAFDKSNNSTWGLDTWLNVVDEEAPVWNYDGDINYTVEVPVGTELTEAEFIEKTNTVANVSDNYTSIENIVIKPDAWQWENVFDTTKVGTFGIDLYAYDELGNTSYNLGITVNVIEETEPEKETVKLILATGSYGTLENGKDIAEIEVAEDGTYKLPEVVAKKGYVFKNWEYNYNKVVAPFNPGYEFKYSQLKALANENGCVAIRAKYDEAEPVKETVKLILATGSYGTLENGKDIAEIEVAEDGTYKLPEVVAKKGYVFKNWEYNYNKVVAPFNPGYEFKYSQLKALANENGCVAIRAKYDEAEPVKETVKLILATGSYGTLENGKDIAEIEVAEDGTYKLPEVVAKKGYVFKNWEYNYNKVVAPFNPGYEFKYSQLKALANENGCVAIRAKYDEAEPVKETVKLILATGSYGTLENGKDIAEIEVAKDGTYKLPEVVAKKGYVFKNWEYNYNKVVAPFNPGYEFKYSQLKALANENGCVAIRAKYDKVKPAVKKQIIVTFTSDYGYVDKAKKNKTVKYVLNETTNSSVKCPYVYSRRGNKYTNVGWGFEGTDRNHTIYAGRTLRFDALSGCVSFDKNGKAYVTIDDKKVKR